MLYNHFTEELLGLQGVKITNVEQEENLIIHLELERKSQNCICCGTAPDTVHDYRLQKIKDIPSFDKNKTKNKQRPNSNCLHLISHFNSLPQLLTKSLLLYSDFFFEKSSSYIFTIDSCIVL